VNIEDSPITRVIDELNAEKKIEEKKTKPVVLFNASDSNEDSEELEKGNENIGVYMKSGMCYSNIKSFLP
jgi:hypothetical protein